MNSGSSQQSTDSQVVSPYRTYVVYDKTTGDIIHIHHSVTFPQGAPMREEPERRVRRLAGDRAIANAAVLKVDVAEVNHRGTDSVSPPHRN